MQEETFSYSDLQLKLRKPIELLIGSLFRMQARTFLLQQIYRWEQLETVEESPPNFGRLVDREVA